MSFKEIRKLYGDISVVVDHDFAKVRDYLVKSADEVASQEDGPFVGQVVLVRKNADIINLCVAIWTHNPDGSYTKFEQNQDFYSFKNIPSFIEEKLSLSRRYEIVFRPSELGTICSERNIKIQTGINDFPEFAKRSARNSGCNNGSLIAEISDAGLYYRVRIYAIGGATPISSFLTTSVKGIESEKQEELSIAHFVKLTIR